jgi:hypothetical protein
VGAPSGLTVAWLLLNSAQLRDIDPGLIELFVDGKEDGLPDAGRLESLGLGSGSVVFMLHRLGWRWEACGSGMVLSEDGLVATKNAESGCDLATGGSPMTEGLHYGAVEVSGGSVFVGAVRPGLTSSGPTGPSVGTASASPTHRARLRRATASACCSTSTLAGI